MKYGIVVNGRVTEPVNIPSPLPSWAASATAFLATMFPGKTGWVVIPDDAVPGTIDNGDGTYTNPAAPVAAPVKNTETLKIFTRRKAAKAAAGGDAALAIYLKSKIGE